MAPPLEVWGSALDAQDFVRIPAEGAAHFFAHGGREVQKLQEVRWGIYHGLP